MSKERPGVRVKTESETKERREREVRVSSLATHVWGPRASRETITPAFRNLQNRF